MPATFEETKVFVLRSTTPEVIGVSEGDFRTVIKQNNDKFLKVLIDIQTYEETYQSDRFYNNRAIAVVVLAPNVPHIEHDAVIEVQLLYKPKANTTKVLSLFETLCNHYGTPIKNAEIKEWPNGHCWWIPC